MENNSKKGLLVFWLSLAALICAAVSLNDSLDQLEKKIGDILTMERKNLIRDLIVLWISVGAFMCAAINLHLLRNKIESKES